MVYSKNYINKKKSFNKKKFLRDNMILKSSISTKYKKVNIIIPSQWTTTILLDSKNNFYTFYLTSPVYYFKFAALFEKTKIYFCYNTNLVTIINFKLKTLSTLWSKEVSTLLAMLVSFSFKKLKFKGKGYYIYKNFRNTIAPQFGYYHRIYIYSYFTKIKFLSKTKLIIFGLVKQDILKTSLGIKQKRSINIFTGRGVRFARQIIYKKTGKVSSYR